MTAVIQFIKLCKINTKIQINVKSKERINIQIVQMCRHNKILFI